MVGEGHSAARAGEIKGQTGAVGNREQAALDVEGQISRRRAGGSVESIASADADHIIIFAAEQRFDRGLRSTAVARAREHRIAQYSRQVLLPVLERVVKAAPAAVFRRIRLGGGEKRRAAGVLGISVPVQRQKIAERGLFAEMLLIIPAVRLFVRTAARGECGEQQRTAHIQRVRIGVVDQVERRVPERALIIGKHGCGEELRGRAVRAADEVGREKARECGKIGGRRERGAFSVRDERHRARSAVFFVAADRVERGAVQLCGEPHAHGIGVLQPGHGGEPAVRGRKAAVDALEQRVPVIQHRALCAVVPFDGQTEAFREKTHGNAGAAVLFDGRGVERNGFQHLAGRPVGNGEGVAADREAADRAVKRSGNRAAVVADFSAERFRDRAEGYHGAAVLEERLNVGERERFAGKLHAECADGVQIVLKRHVERRAAVEGLAVIPVTAVEPFLEVALLGVMEAERNGRVVMYLVEMAAVAVARLIVAELVEPPVIGGGVRLRAVVAELLVHGRRGVERERCGQRGHGKRRRESGSEQSFMLHRDPPLYAGVDTALFFYCTTYAAELSIALLNGFRREKPS